MMMASSFATDRAAWLGFGLGNMRNEVCIWDAANPEVDMDLSHLQARRPDIGEKGVVTGPKVHAIRTTRWPIHP